jgi:ABC-type uncharacterized transport system substrate-binding protein
MKLIANNYKINLFKLNIDLNKYLFLIYNKMVKKYTKKNGEVVIKDYDQKTYNKTYYEKNKEKINDEKYICESCNKEVKTRNRFNHTKTERHKLKQQLHETLNNMLDRVEHIEQIVNNKVNVE